MSLSGPNGRRLCVFGGTFDPIHNAHLTMASAARDRFSLDRILFVPAGNPPHKTAGFVTPYEQRLRMVEIACEPYSDFIPSRLEEGVKRSYTVTTLERVRQELGPRDSLFFLIGADAFSELETWKRWREVVTLTEFIVVARPGIHDHIPENARVHPLDLELPVSSSSIRARLAAGEPTPEVPAEVRRYIDQHGLYRASKQSVTAFE